MNFYVTGTLIRKMRLKRKLSVKELAKGVCPSQLLEQIEHNLVDADALLIHILMQRLGGAPDKIEYILTEQDYKWSYALDRFPELVFRGRGDWAYWLLPRLQENPAKNPVQQMYYHRCHALYQYYIMDDKNRAAQELAEALLLTSSSILMAGLPINPWIEQHKASDYLHTKNSACVLSATELENLLALVRVLREQEAISVGEATKVLEWCQKYINSHISSHEEHAKIFCKCVWLLADCYITEEKETIAFELCDSAFEELQDCGISYFMIPLLRQMLRCTSVYTLQRKAEKYKSYLDTLTRLYDVFGKAWYPQDSILFNCCQHEYFLDYEVLRGGRLTMGFTQAQMISGIFENPRALSQIENRKTKPKKNNFQKLMRKLNLPKTRYSGLVLTDSEEMLEKAQELTRLVSKQSHIEMERHIRELQKGIDMSLPENQRSIRYFENVIDYTNESRGYQDVLQEDYRLLRETYDIARTLYRPPFRMEANYINQIAIMLRKTGRMEEYFALYEKVLDTYHKSKVKEKYHFASYSVMLGNLAAQKEPWKESLELSEKVIRFSLDCGRISLLHFNLMSYLCALEEAGDTDKEYCRAMLKDVIVLCALVKNEKDLAIAQQYYREHYGEESWNQR